MSASVDEFGTGWQKWNPQAWVDFLTVKIMLMKGGDVIPKTYMPILRLVSEDANKADEGYCQLLSARERVNFFDSPRDKWRKMYGSYIRELDWVYGELSNHFPHEQYQELVIDIMARSVRDSMGYLLPSAEKMTHKKDLRINEESSKGGNLTGRLVEKLASFLSRHISPVNGIVGPVEQKSIPGGMEIYIPHCWMHAAPCDGRTQDRACVEGCKGAFEAIFTDETPVSMYFEPHLPEFSCTLTVKVRQG